jgi:capsular polysaccharide export protein
MTISVHPLVVGGSNKRTIALGISNFVRSLLFYFDLIQAALTCLRLLSLPKDRAITFGLFINAGEGRFLPNAIGLGSTFIRINYPRRKRGWRANDFDRLVRTLVRLAKRRPLSAVIWGYRDRLNHGLDIGAYFDDYYRVERALIRPSSILPANTRTAFVLGRKSIYFDGRVNTDLEQSLNHLVPGQLQRSDEGNRILRHVLESGITKYALQDHYVQPHPLPDLLIVGQVAGDQAIAETEVLARTNPDLIELASRHLIATGQYKKAYFKPHPKSKSTQADLAYLQAHHPGIGIIEAGANIVPILAATPAIATVTSGVGLEAALRGCPVHCFGISFYSNWGFTNDYLSCSRRTNRLSAEDVFLHMVMAQTVYIDWRTGKHTTALEAFGIG